MKRYSNVTQYLIVSITSKNQNNIKWFIENFPPTVKTELSFDSEYYKQSIKVDKMESWQQTREYIEKVKNSYNDLMVTITDMSKEVYNY